MPDLRKYEEIIPQLTTISQLERLLVLIEDESAAMDRILDSFIMESTSKHNNTVQTLELERTNLSTTLALSNNIESVISRAKSITSPISVAVKSVDLERSQVSTTIEYVEQVTLLKTNITLIADYLEHKQWFEASKLIHQILQLPEYIFDGEFTKKVVPCIEIPDDPLTLVNKWRTELCQIYVKNFTATQDVNELTFYFQLFPLIGEAETGLQVYSKFICGIIAEQSRGLQLSSQEYIPGFHSHVLRQLYSSVSKLINDHSKIIMEYYGECKNVILMIQKEVDLQSALIVDSFKEQNDLSEFSDIFFNWSMYNNFLDQKYGVDATRTSEGELTHFATKMFGEMDRFNSLVNDHLDKSLQRANELENVPMLYEFDGVHTSTVMEDLIVFIKNDMIINVNTGQMNIMMSFINKINGLVDTFFDTIVAKLRTLAPRHAMIIRPAAKPEEQERYNSPGLSRDETLTYIKGAYKSMVSDEEDMVKFHQFLIYLNTVATSVEFFKSVFDEAETPIKRHFDDDAWELVTSLNKSIDLKASEIIGEHLKMCFEPVFRYKIRLDANFRDSWNQLMAPYQKILHKDVYSKLLAQCVEFIASQLETRIWNGSMNYDTLDRDVGNIISLVTQGHYFLRDKFARVTQIILSMSLDGEELDDIHWVITPQERARASKLVH